MKNNYGEKNINDSEFYNNILIDDEEIFDEQNEFADELNEETSDIKDEENNEYFKGYLNTMSKEDVLTQEEELALAKRIASGDEAAMEEMIKHNFRLVLKVAKKYKWSGLDKEDLISNGTFGLMSAVKTFDYTRGLKFSTYAYPCIENSIIGAIKESSRIIRLPSYVFDKLNKVKEAERKLTAENFCVPTIEEIADELGMSPEEVLEIKEEGRSTSSLDKELDSDEGDGCTLEDTVADENSLTPEEKIVSDTINEKILEIMKKHLSEHEEEVLLLRFGMKDGKEYTLNEVGKILGISHEAVRQIETKAMRKLRYPLHKEHFDD